MPLTIGAKIALDGEQKYKEAIKNIKSETKAFQSEMKLLSSQFSSNTDSLKSYTAKQEVLSKQIDHQKETIEVLNKALADSHFNYRKAEDRVDSLKKALESAKQQYGEDSDEVKKLSKSLSSAENAQNRLARETNDFESELNNAKASLNKMNRELDEVKKHTSGIGKIKTEFEEIKGKIEQAKEKMEGFRTVLGGIGKAVKTGLAVGTAAVAAIGTASVAAGRQIWSMANEVSAAGDEIDKGSQKLRISAGDYQRLKYAADLSGTSMTALATAQKKLAASGSELDLKQAIEQVASISDENERAAAATELFGAKAGQELMPLLNAGKDGIAAMYAEAEKYGMIMSDEAVAASAAFQDSLTQLKGTMTGLKNEMIGSLLPSLTNLTSGLNEIMNGNPDQGILLIKDAVSGLLGSIEELLPTLLKLGGEILQALVTSIVDSLPMIIEVGVPIVMELLQAIISNLDLILDAALQLLDALMIGLEANSEQLASVAVVLLGKLTIGLIRMLPQLMQIGVQLIMGLLQGLNDPGMMQQLIQAAVLCTEQLISTFIKSLPQILSAGVELVKGLWQGITGSLDWLKGKIKGWVGNVMSFIKNLFGIHSPSAVMRDEVGKNLMLGIGAGIDAYAGVPQEAIDKATASLTATAGMTYQVDYIHDQIAAAAPPTAMTYSGGGNGNPGNGGTPLETVISLLQIIAANSDKPIVLSDGTLLGWMNAALGRASSQSERGVAT